MTFTWFAAAFDPDDVRMRAASLAAMLAVGAMAAAIAMVGEDGDALFAGAYAVFHLIVIGLSLRSRAADPASRRYCTTDAVGNTVGALLWIVSVPTPEPGRHRLWAASAIPFLATPVIAARRIDVPFHDPACAEAVRAVHDHRPRGVGRRRRRRARGHRDRPHRGHGRARLRRRGGGVVDLLRLHAGEPSDRPRCRLTTGFVWGDGHLAVFAGVAIAAVGIELGIQEAAKGRAERWPPAGRRACDGVLLFVAATTLIRLAVRPRVDAGIASQLALMGVLAVSWPAAAEWTRALLVGLATALAVGGELARGRRRTATT